MQPVQFGGCWALLAAIQIIAAFLYLYSKLKKKDADAILKPASVKRSIRTWATINLITGTAVFTFFYKNIDSEIYHALLAFTLGWIPLIGYAYDKFAEFIIRRVLLRNQDIGKDDKVEDFVKEYSKGIPYFQNIDKIRLIQGAILKNFFYMIDVVESEKNEGLARAANHLYQVFGEEAVKQVMERLTGSSDDLPPKIKKKIPADVLEDLEKHTSVRGKLQRILSFFSHDLIEVFVEVAPHTVKDKQRENQIIRAKKELERTFDTNPNPIFLVNKKYTIKRANKAALRLLGFEAEAGKGVWTNVIEKKCFDVFKCNNTDCPVVSCNYEHCMVTCPNDTETEWICLPNNKENTRYVMVNNLIPSKAFSVIAGNK